ncbi:serine hydrolase domain-containing protein [Polluticoccus soli]|uniref:serine hydrolase domain-containing protein n=1 Tax=Polluticoccus soli TaxID=3034150 RepID=UPI0023E2F55C|nr:serine hydrolase [Flavipsychrobacter sp. JY13-12]
MKLKFAVTLALLLSIYTLHAQPTFRFADSIGKQYNIPEIAYAVVSADSIYEMKVLGVRKIHSSLVATPNDRFRLGSNTKAITGFIAALLVKRGKISWETKFFDLFPELKQGSKKEYHNLTLLNLLTFRTRLFMYTYTYAQPVKGQFTGSAAEQRYQFARWFFKHDPVTAGDSINFSNLGYVAAGLMLEKTSGKSYRQLIKELGNPLGIEFGFGRPNATDTKQTWGHNAALVPEAKADDYKLDWLEAAGNLNCTLPGYVKFIQLQLKGLKGQSSMLSRQEFDFLHFGMPRFTVGWLPAVDNKYGAFSFNIGNPGTFLSKVYVYKDIDRAFILFANVQSDAADDGLDILYDELKRRYSGQ